MVFLATRRKREFHCKEIYKNSRWITRNEIYSYIPWVCFYDDKYDDKVAEKRLKSSLEGSLKDLEEYVPFDTDVVYMTIQPSDDMYFPYVVEDIQNTFVANRAIGYKNGYINDYHTKEIAEYNPDTNPPFFTIMFPRDIFLDYEKHYSYTGPYKSHEHIKNIMQYDLFEKKGYIVGTHGRNISTVYNHPWKGRILSKEENENIQISTNTFFVDPIPYKSSKSLVLRKIFNALPFNNLIRSLYHKLPANLRKL